MRPTVARETSVPALRGRLTLALFQPDIPQNTGTMLRLCACLGIDAAIIGPAGFPTSDRHFRRSGMDYLDSVALTRHDCFTDFESWRGALAPPRRLILLTTKASAPYWDCSFEAGDILMVGRESAGVPEEVAACADLSVAIPMQPEMRSLNVAVAAAMVVGEALRQISAKESAARESAD
jgi:tRNA (cytidine/uridine-2'-O-)-methyltransferase